MRGRSNENARQLEAAGDFVNTEDVVICTSLDTL